MDLDATSPSTSASFDIYQASLTRAALTATKQAFVLPSDIQFHRTLDKSFAAQLDVVSARVFSLTDKLLRYASGSSGKGKGKAVLKNEDDLLEGYHMSVVDTVDQLYENADKVLDQLMGRSKPAQGAAGASVAPKPTTNKFEALDASLLHASNIPKPQLKFMRSVDNSAPWYPSVKSKTQHNAALDPTQANLEIEEDDPRNAHPYLYETLHVKYPERLFEYAEPIPPRSFDETPFTWVETPAQLSSLLDKLRLAKEIAVDLEYHSLRSYYGFVCLMQISTREEDWVIDTLALRDELETLNEVFTDPGIIKVFHGADSDIVWLQQDFNLYIVNLFDTYHASYLLGGFPKNGLASLLTYFCEFNADKRYQLADWRIRPLPEEMLFYARSDTHFLLFIYDNLRNLLIQHSNSAESVQQVLVASSRTALQVYVKELYDVEHGLGAFGWKSFLSKFGAYGQVPGEESDKRKAIIVAMHVWRDRVAREMDESTAYILPSKLIFRLANAPILPKDVESFLRIVPLTVIRDRASELFDVITNAKLPASLLARRALAQSAIPQDVATSAAGSSLDVFGVQESSSGGKTDALLPNLWGTSIPTASSSTSVARTSSLFGSVVTKPLGAPLAPSATYASIISSSSSLFGAGPSKASTSPGASTSTSAPSTSDRFSEVVQRIHSTLVLTPSVPVPIPVSNPSLAVAMQVDEPDPTTILEMPAEVAFVPASQRTTLPSSSELSQPGASTTKDPLTGDTIVVVGRRKEKKVKKKQNDTSAPSTSTSVTGSNVSSTSSASTVHQKAGEEDDDDEVITFDYASVPNILDDDDSSSAAVTGQKRSKKQKGSDKAKRAKGSAAASPSPYGDFKAPPRSRAEARSGNISHTFKK